MSTDLLIAEMHDINLPSDRIKQLRTQLAREWAEWKQSIFPENCYVCFGEVVALNEGSRAFNDEMQRSGDLIRALVVSYRVEAYVWQLVNEAKQI